MKINSQSRIFINKETLNNLIRKSIQYFKKLKKEKPEDKNLSNWLNYQILFLNDEININDFNDFFYSLSHFLLDLEIGEIQKNRKFAFIFLQQWLKYSEIKKNYLRFLEVLGLIRVLNQEFPGSSGAILQDNILKMIDSLLSTPDINSDYNLKFQFFYETGCWYKAKSNGNRVNNLEKAIEYLHKANLYCDMSSKKNHNALIFFMLLNTFDEIDWVEGKTNYIRPFTLLLKALNWTINCDSIKPFDYFYQDQTVHIDNSVKFLNLLCDIFHKRLFDYLKELSLETNKSLHSKDIQKHIELLIRIKTQNVPINESLYEIGIWLSKLKFGNKECNKICTNFLLILWYINQGENSISIRNKIWFIILKGELSSIFEDLKKIAPAVENSNKKISVLIQKNIKTLENILKFESYSRDLITELQKIANFLTSLKYYNLSSLSSNALLIYEALLDNHDVNANPEKIAKIKYRIGAIYKEMHQDFEEEEFYNVKDMLLSAISYYEKTGDLNFVAILQNILGFLHLKLQQSINKDAILYEGLSYLLEAKETFESMKNSDAYVMANMDIANCYSRITVNKQTNEENALKYYKDAMKIVKPDCDEWALINLSLGGFYSICSIGNINENFNAAEKYLNAALGYYQKIGDGNKLESTIFSLGNLYGSSDDPKKIEISNRYFSLLLDNKPVTNISAWAKNLMLMGRNYLFLKDYSYALKCLKPIFEKDAFIFKKEPHDFLNFKLLLVQVLLKFKEEKKKKEALNHLEEALMLLNLQSTIVDPNAAIELWKSNKQYFDRSIIILIEAGILDKALFWIETIKSRNMLIDYKIKHLPHQDNQLQDLVEKYFKVTQNLQNLRTKSIQTGFKFDNFRTSKPFNDVKSPKENKMHISDNHNPLSSLEKQQKIQKDLFGKIKLISPDYAELIKPKVANKKDFKTLIKDEYTALISLWMNIGDIFIIIVSVDPTTKKILFHHLKTTIKMEYIEKYMTFYTHGYELYTNDRGGFIIPDRDPIMQLLENTGNIFSDLFDWLLKNNLKKLYISSHGIMQAIPIHAAWLKSKNIYAIECFHISYLPSFSMGAILKETPSPRNDKILAMFYEPDDKKLALPAGREEFDQIEKIFKTKLITPPLLGTNASFKNLIYFLKENKDSIKNIFISCHGNFGEDGFSLYLSDGEINQSEILEKIDINGSHVSLSACKTGNSLTWLNLEDEYFALDSVFHLLGARSCLSSFFLIPDVTTAEITKKFHEKLVSGLSTFEAFHQSIREYLNHYIIDKNIGVSSKSKLIKRNFLNKNGKKISAGISKKSHPIFWAFLKYSGIF